MGPQVIGTLRQGVARVALLVDGDNLPPVLSGAILSAAGLLGRVDLRRVYAAEAGAKGWDAAHGFRITRVAGAKNGTDLLLCIEAVEVACQGGFDVFAIASDDRDFSHLAHWLRERGVHVLGLGTGKSPESWRAACSEFDLLGTAPPAAPLPTAPAMAELDLRLRSAIGRQAAGRRMMEVGQALSKAGVRPPEGRTWRDYLATRPDLYGLDPRGPDARVRWIGA